MARRRSIIADYTWSGSVMTGIVCFPRSIDVTSIHLYKYTISPSSFLCFIQSKNISSVYASVTIKNMAGRIGKGIASVVGLGQEAYQHHKEKKEAASNSELQVPSDDPPAYSDIEDDEDDWVADEAQQQLNPEDEDDKKESTEQIIEWFKKRHPDPAGPISKTGRLPGPVIIPQKRPDMKSRGFVRAYAPALESCGVDKGAFLDFIEGFTKEINKQGYFHASNIAVGLSVTAYTAAVAPSAIVHFTAMAVHISIETGRRLYISKQHNSYIDEMNAHYFQPRGLYAMIVSPFLTCKQYGYTDICR